MLDSKTIDDIVKKLNDSVPDSVKVLEQDLQAKFRQILQSTFAKLDLVTREEFDVQVKVVEKLHKKLARLEKDISVLEQVKSTDKK